MKRRAHHQRRPSGMSCDCGHAWYRHGTYGCRFSGCVCRSRVVDYRRIFDRNVIRVVVEWPLEARKEA